MKNKLFFLLFIIMCSCAEKSAQVKPYCHCDKTASEINSALKVLKTNQNLVLLHTIQGRRHSKGSYYDVVNAKSDNGLIKLKWQNCNEYSILLEEGNKESISSIKKTLAVYSENCILRVYKKSDTYYILTTLSDSTYAQLKESNDNYKDNYYPLAENEGPYVYMIEIFPNHEAMQKELIYLTGRMSHNIIDSNAIYIRRKLFL